MEWLSYDIRKIKRLGTFPFKVKMLYFSHNHNVDVKFSESGLEKAGRGTSFSH